MKTLSKNKTRYLIVFVFVVVFVVIMCVTGMFVPDKIGSIQNYEEPSFVKNEDTFSFEKGDLIARPNVNHLPGTSKIDSGRMFGHMAIVVEGSVGKTVDEALRKAMVVEVFIFDQPTRSFVLDSEKQVRKVPAMVPFGSRFTGIRYRLRANLTNEQKDSMGLFLNSQINKHKYNLVSFKNDKYNKRDMNCATFCWFAFKKIAGIDIDSNRGIIVYPNDCIKSEYFNGPDGRIRF